MFKRFFAGLWSSVALCGSVQAVPILGVTASTTNSSFAGTDIQDTVNGNGLSPGQVASAVHVPPGPGTAWATADPAATVNLTFNLNGLYSLTGMTIWTSTFAQGAPAGIQGVLVSSSTDGVLFTPIAGAPSVFAQGSTLLPAQPGQAFSWAPVSAAFVRFNVISNYGDSLVIFSEALFEAPDPPAPELGSEGAMTAWFLVGLTSLGSRRRISGGRSGS